MTLQGKRDEGREAHLLLPSIDRIIFRMLSSYLKLAGHMQLISRDESELINADATQGLTPLESKLYTAILSNAYSPSMPA